MTTQSLGTVDTAAPERGGSEAATTSNVHSGSFLRLPWNRSSRTGADAAKAPGRVRILLWSVLLRGLVLVAAWIIAFTTATGVIPNLAAYLHQASGASRGQLTVDGTIALWAAPLAFLVLVLAVAELALMRSMWRWATRHVEKLKARTWTHPVSDEASIDPIRSEETTERRRNE